MKPPSPLPAAPSPQHNQTSYENIALLLHQQLEHALGKHEIGGSSSGGVGGGGDVEGEEELKEWRKVLNITDLVLDRNAALRNSTNHLPIDMHNHELFHDLRKYFLLLFLQMH